MGETQKQKAFKRVTFYLIGTGLGAGNSRYMPGTVGTIWGWALFLIFDYLFTDALLFAIIFFSFLIGVAASDFIEGEQKEKDPSKIVIDEMVAFWLVLFILPRGNDGLYIVQNSDTDFFLIQIQAFFMFRFFDIVKPWPTNIVDKRVSGGLGVMLDDIVAAFQTLIIFSIFYRFELV